MNRRALSQRLSRLEDEMKGRRRVHVVRELQRAMASIQRDMGTVDWTKVFKATFMLLFVAYPGEGGCVGWWGGVACGDDLCTQARWINGTRL